MFFNSKIRRSKKAARCNRRSTFFRPVLEALENRTLPSSASVSVGSLAGTEENLGSESASAASEGSFGDYFSRAKGEIRTTPTTAEGSINTEIRNPPLASSAINFANSTVRATNDELIVDVGTCESQAKITFTHSVEGSMTDSLGAHQGGGTSASLTMASGVTLASGGFDFRGSSFSESSMSDVALDIPANQPLRLHHTLTMFGSVDSTNPGTFSLKADASNSIEVRLTPLIPFETQPPKTLFGRTFRLGSKDGFLVVDLDIQLTGSDPGEDIRSEWEQAIEKRWNQQFKFMNGDVQYPIKLDVDFVTSEADMVVEVRGGIDRASTGIWYIEMNSGTAAHEVAHMLGLYDEYSAGFIVEKAGAGNIEWKLKSRQGQFIKGQLETLPTETIFQIAEKLAANINAQASASGFGNIASNLNNLGIRVNRVTVALPFTEDYVILGDNLVKEISPTLDPNNPIIDPSSIMGNVEKGEFKKRHYERIVQWLSEKCGRAIVLAESPSFQAGEPGDPPFELAPLVDSLNNSAPVIDFIGNQTIEEGSTISMTFGARDSDGDSLKFTLDHAPSGASIHAMTGAFIWAPADGPSTVEVQLRVTDDGSPSLTDTETFTITVKNVAPVLTITGRSTGLGGEPLTVNLEANDPSLVDQTAGFIYDIDWNGDEVVDETVIGPPSIRVDHFFLETGFFTVQVTATDKDGGTSARASHIVNIIQPVEVDVKPGSDSNPINLKANGVLPVAVLTTPEFDATAVDRSDLSRIRLGDVNRRPRVSPIRSTLADVDQDGDLDALFHFSVPEIRNSGSLITGSTQAELMGFTTVDQAIRGTDSVRVFFPGSPVTAARMPGHARPSILTAAEVQPVLAEALARWQTTGINTSALRGIDIRITDLGGTTLGLASGNTNWLDNNAAGWGWFVDPTPWDDSEFTTPGNQGEQNRMDLLTVLEHEIGHFLGLEHEADGLMADTLAIGVKSSPVPDWSSFNGAILEWLSAKKK